MFCLTCPRCPSEELRCTSELVALHNTEHGPVGIIRCSAGHLLATMFATGHTVEVDLERLEQLAASA